MPGPDPRNAGLEDALFKKGVRLLAGVDEAGRGPLAGPVVAAAVAIGPGWDDPGVDDSKRLSAQRRESLAEAVKASVLSWALGLCQAEEVDRLNIHRASLTAMARALAGLAMAPERVLVDGRFTPDVEVPCQAVVGGDGLCSSISAASILAKVERDRLMQDWHRRYPLYNFAANKGYGTAEHRRALELHGPCPIHRRSYNPVAQMSLGLGGAK